MLVEENLTERHGRALLKLPDDELRRRILDKVVKKGLNVNNTEVLVEDILESLRKEEEIKPKQNIKSLINIRIYLNTIRKAYKAIKEFGINAKYEEIDREDFVEVIIRVPKV